MEGLRHPVGELPPDVYWRRRATILAVVVLAILVTFFLLKAAFASGGSTPTPGTSVSPSDHPSMSPNPSDHPSMSPNPSESTGTVDIRACGTGDLSIDLAPSTRDFADPSQPAFNATITQTGLTDCVVDTTAIGTELLITSGSDRIWSSVDCASGALSPQNITLAPDASRVIQIGWPRIRSNESCGTNLPNPRAGTYHAVLTLDGVDSNTTTFTLSD